MRNQTKYSHTTDCNVTEENYRLNEMLNKLRVDLRILSVWKIATNCATLTVDKSYYHFAFPVDNYVQFTTALQTRLTIVFALAQVLQTRPFVVLVGGGGGRECLKLGNSPTGCSEHRLQNFSGAARPQVIRQSQSEC